MLGDCLLKGISVGKAFHRFHTAIIALLHLYRLIIIPYDLIAAASRHDKRRTPYGNGSHGPKDTDGGCCNCCFFPIPMFHIFFLLNGFKNSCTDPLVCQGAADFL